MTRVRRSQPPHGPWLRATPDARLRRTADGEAYKNSLFSHCAAANIEVSVFTYAATDNEAIARKVTELAETNIRVVMWVGSNAGVSAVMTNAYRLGLFDSTKGAMWVVSDGVGPAAIAEATAGLADAPLNAMSGVVRIFAVGGTEDNTRYKQASSPPACARAARARTRVRIVSGLPLLPPTAFRLPPPH